MADRILTIPCLDDNYAYLIHKEDTNTTLLVDAPDATPIEAALTAEGWTLDYVLITHHHWDHVDGLAQLQKHHSPILVGAKADEHRLPALDLAVNAGGSVDIKGLQIDIIDVPGHTIGHIAYYIPEFNALFSADSLMVMGCGRLFEGTPDQMWASLETLMTLPSDTLIYGGHEYTQANTAFALSVDGDNPVLLRRAQEIDAMRAKDIPTNPALLSFELQTNPFLRAKDADFKRRLGMAEAPDAAVFAELRARKDNF
ncbi:MAG: hydroxyacylglutathione hydrolase [Halocynthiibacter sp.]